MFKVWFLEFFSGRFFVLEIYRFYYMVLNVFVYLGL